MTPLQLKKYILGKCKIPITDDNLSFPNLLQEINIQMRNICEAITDAHQNFFGVIANKDLIESTTEMNREYNLPNDILNNILFLELKLDGQNWVRAKNVNLTPHQDFSFQEDWIRANYSNNEPKYAIFRNSLIILSGEIKPVVNGMRLWYLNYPADIPTLEENIIDLSVATAPLAIIKMGLPLQFHELLSRAVIIEWKSMFDQRLTGREPLFEQDLAIKIKRLRGLDLNQIIKAKSPFNDGSQY